MISPQGNPLLLFGGITLVVISHHLRLARLPNARGRKKPKQRSWHCHQPACRPVDGHLLSSRKQVHGVAKRTWSVRNSAFLRYRHRLMRVAGKLSFYANRRRNPSHYVGLDRRNFPLAYGGRVGWRNLGLRGHSQLRLLTSKFRWARDLLLHRTRCNHGFGFLGSICLARVPLALTAGPNSPRRNVRLLSRWPRCHRCRASLPKLTRITA